MIAGDELSAAARRDRAILVACVVIVSAVAWAYMARMASDVGGCHVAAPSARRWSWPELASAGAMWAAMMLAMMLPVVSPWLLAFSREARGRSRAPSPLPHAGSFLLGYGVIWIAYSALAAAAQLALQRTALLSPQWATTSPLLAAGLCAVAGVYQWTPLRDACMTHCRSPLGFFLAHWRDGRRGAFTMGLQHGTYCVGCCWALMALSFVFGVMNLAWMALVTVFLLVEKATSAGPWMSRSAGALLVLCAAGLLAGAW